MFRNLPTPENIAFFREEMADWSDERLGLEAAKDPNTAWGIAAKLMLSDRQRNVEEKRHVALLKEISLPHWTVVPSFKLLIGALIISVLALVVAVAALPQVQQVVWPANSTQASAPGSQQAQIASASESGSSKAPQQGKKIMSIPASSPLAASLK